MAASSVAAQDRPTDGQQMSIPQALGLALSHHGAGRLAEAEQLYRQILAADPGNPDGLHLYGVLARQVGRADIAIDAIGKAILRNGAVPEFHNNIGIAYAQLGRLDEAVASYEQALALRPIYGEAANNLGNALQQQGRTEEAIAQYRRAIPLYEAARSAAPLLAEVHGNLATALLAAGRVDEAIAAFEQALALDPKRGFFYRNIAFARRVRAEEPLLAALRRLEGEIDALPEPDRIELHFALGKALDDVGETDASFRHYLAGNALKRAHIAYDEAAVLGDFRRVAALATPELLRAKRGSGNPSRLPIFILGLPRSGTSLVEQMLASHPRIFGGGERHDFRDAVGALPGHYPELLGTLGADALAALGATYAARLRTAAPQAERITDKMPGNFLYVGLIHLALPNARILHIRRDAVDTCLSCFGQLFTADQPFAYDLGELGRFWQGYDTLMAHWRAVLPEGAMLEISYEALVADPEGEARRMLDYCGLPWSPAVLDFHKNTRPVHTASMSQVRQPLYRSSVGRQRPSAALLAPLLEALGRTA
jgi:tetratricopeptide (TPR) repeat protein